MRRLFQIGVRCVKRLGLLRLFRLVCPDVYAAIKYRLIVWSCRSCGGARGGYELLSGRADSVFLPKVTVIVPNYNHAPFLKERLDSIYRQTYKNFDVVLLDDCSADGSRLILDEYARRHPERTRTVYNESNSGSPFAQWQKGIEIADGDLIWIAESDDFCEDDFLEKIVPSFVDEMVMLAFGHTDFIQDGKRVWTLEEYLWQWGGAMFTRSFALTAHQCVNRFFGIINIIPNVSSCVFRNCGVIPLFADQEWRHMRICGDWVFYLHMMRAGVVSYVSQARNYYRQHSANTSVVAQKTKRYYDEHVIVCRHLQRLYNLDFDVIPSLKRRLYGYFAESNHGMSRSDFAKAFGEGGVLEAKTKTLNVAMCGFAFSFGGGETVPIVMANELFRQGYAVTFVNCGYERTNPEVRKQLNRAIPVLNLEMDFSRLHDVLVGLGADVVHSHHASVDIAVASVKPPQMIHAVTLHGMYETMTDGDLKNNARTLSRIVDLWFYTADKNVVNVCKYGINGGKRLIKMPNALARGGGDRSAVDIRKSLGLGEDDFVLCLVSRALRSKGWGEAVRAVSRARESSQREIKLLLVGEGEMYDQLKGRVPAFVKMLGYRSDIRDLFASSDMGFLPTRFPGESFPLVIIDCLFAGRPVLASDIGEIRFMLEKGEDCAGCVFGLEGGEIPVEKLADLIRRCAEDKPFYDRMCRQVQAAAERFDISEVIQAYCREYSAAVGSGDRHAR